MKKVLCIICLTIISVFTLVGCSTVRYSTAILADKSVQQLFQVELDQTEIENAGYDYQDVINQIEQKFAVVKQNQILKYIRPFMKKYEGVQVVCAYSMANLCIYMTYDSVSTYTAYNKFVYEVNGMTVDDEDNEILVENFLYIKHITKTTTVYNELENNQFAKDMLEYFDGTTNGTTAFTLNDCTYEFYYGVPSSKVHSNSDKRVYQDGVYYHIWSFSADETNNEIELYTIEIKPVSWYILALVLTVIFTGILCMVIVFQKNIKKNSAKDIASNEI